MTDESIFTAAMALKTEAERQAYLDQVCKDDPALRAEVEALLRADAGAGSFLNHPPVGTEATIAIGAEHDTVDSDAGPVSLSFLQPCDTPGRLGKLVGKTGEYEVIEVVGQGGMGAVVRAFDTKLSRIVAVKIMAPELAANPMAVKRFLREAQTAAAIHHEHVVTIHAIDDAHRPPFIVMQFVEGQNLQQKLDREGALDLRAILRIGSQMAAGLAAAHKQGLIHRDVKPANILLENGVERVKITDFGLARAANDLEMTQTGMIAGTPQYMSPEQAQGDPVDARSDLFSLGSVIYTMCTGRPGFRADNTMAVMRRVCEDNPRPLREVNPEIPLWLEAIVGKLLAKNPADRFQTAAEVADLLSQHLAHEQNPAQVARPTTVLLPAAQTPAEILNFETRVLRVSGFMSIASAAVALFFLMFRYDQITSDWPAPIALWIFVGGLLSLPQGLAIFYGAMRADSRQSHDWAIAAALLSLVPTNIFLIAVLPITIWTLATLRRLGDRADSRGTKPPAKPAKAARPDDLTPQQRHRRSLAIATLMCGVMVLALCGVAYFIREAMLPIETITVLSDDPEVIVTIDDRVSSNSPLSSQHDPNWPRGGPNWSEFWSRRVTPGTHRVRALKGTQVVYDETFVIKRGEQKTIDLKGRTSLALPGNGNIEEIYKLAASASDWTPLFNGQDLAGWTPNPDSPGNWRVEGDALVGGGPSELGLLHTVRSDYEDFHLRAEVLVEGDAADGGIFFRAGPQTSNELNLCFDPKLPTQQTGSLVVHKPTTKDSVWTSAPAGMAKPNEWMTLEILVVGDQALTKVNGRAAAASRELCGNPRGQIVLQHLGPGTVVRFRKIEIKELPTQPALQFDGVDDVVTAPNIPFDQFKAFTVEAWVKDWRQAILCQGQASDPENSLWLSTGEQLPTLDLSYPARCSGWEFGSGTNAEHFLGDPPPGVWTHLAMVFDGQKQHFFVGGKLVQSKLAPPPGPLEATRKLVLGAHDFPNGLNHGAGMLGPVRISSSARWVSDFDPPSEFVVDAQTELLYAMQDQDPNQLLDTSGHNRHGVIAGATRIHKPAVSEGPPRAIAPFTAEQARAHQDAWAAHLGRETEINNSLGMQLRLIPPGEFLMGSTQEETDRLVRSLEQGGANDYDKFVARGTSPQHKVRITRPFYLAAREVTVGQYRKFIDATKHVPTIDQLGVKRFSWTSSAVEPNADERAVIGVSWDDAKAFCKWLSEEEGQTYDLPSEAQWEYACRAGTTTAWSFGDDASGLEKHAVYGRASFWPAEVVGSKAANPFGLFDMHGNADEWCLDWHDSQFYAQSPSDDPVCLANPKDKNSGRVVRSGTSHSAPWWTRSTTRAWDFPATPNNPKGFRVALVGDLKAKSTDGWTSLFNQQDLTGWKMHPDQPGTWEVKDGILTGSEKQSYLFSERGDYANFHLRVEARINDGGDSGIYFRTPFELGWQGMAAKHLSPTGGYEAELHKNPSHPEKTGSIFGLGAVTDDTLVKPDEWFTLEVIADGNRFVTKINGVEAANCEDPQSRFSAGHLALQVFRPQTVVEFRTIEIKELPATQKTIPSIAVAPFDAAQAKAHQDAWASHLGIPVEHANSIGMKLRLIPPGEFVMGTADEELQAVQRLADVQGVGQDSFFVTCLASERPAHRVVLTSPWYCGVHEVTIGQFEEFVKATGYKTEAETDGRGGGIFTGPVNEMRPGLSWKNPGAEQSTPRHPVTQVTHRDALAFCKWLSEEEQLEYRLPTEAEWEFACRAGTVSRFVSGEELTEREILPEGHAYAIGRTAANPLGICDLHGNVMEWCADYWDEGYYALSAVENPRGPVRTEKRVVRGGAWGDKSAWSRSASRRGHLPDERNYGCGFRVVLAGDLSAIGKQSVAAEPQPVARRPAVISRSTRVFTGEITEKGDDSVFASAWSPEGNRAVTGHFGGTVAVWDFKTGQQQHAFAAHPQTVHALAFDPKGKLLASGGEDGTIRLWNTETWELAGTLEGHTGRIGHLAFIDDGASLLSVSWDYQTEKDNTIRIWDVAERKVRQTHVEPVGHNTHAALAPGEKLLAVANAANSSVRLWDLEKGSPAHDFLGQPTQPISVAFSRDGARVAAGYMARERVEGDYNDPANSVVRMWDVKSGNLLQEFKGHAGPVVGLEFSPDDRHLLSLAGGRHDASSQFVKSSDGTLRIWEAATGRERVRIDPQTRTNVARWTHDGMAIWSGLRVWDVSAALDGKSSPE